MRLVLALLVSVTVSHVSAQGVLRDYVLPERPDKFRPLSEIYPVQYPAESKVRYQRQGTCQELPTADKPEFLQAARANPFGNHTVSRCSGITDKICVEFLTGTLEGSVRGGVLIYDESGNLVDIQGLKVNSPPAGMVHYPEPGLRYMPIDRTRFLKGIDKMRIALNEMKSNPRKYGTHAIDETERHIAEAETKLETIDLWYGFHTKDIRSLTNYINRPRQSRDLILSQGTDINVSEKAKLPALDQLSGDRGNDLTKYSLETVGFINRHPRGFEGLQKGVSPSDDGAHVKEFKDEIERHESIVPKRLNEVKEITAVSDSVAKLMKCGEYAPERSSGSTGTKTPGAPGDR